MALHCYVPVVCGVNVCVVDVWTPWVNDQAIFVVHACGRVCVSPMDSSEWILPNIPSGHSEQRRRWRCVWGYVCACAHVCVYSRVIIWSMHVKSIGMLCED